MDSILEMNPETGREFSHTNPQDDPHLYPRGLNLDWEGKVRPSPTTVIRSPPVNPAIYYPRDDTRPPADTPRVSEYRIANSELEVNNYIKKGYVPFGNLAVVPNPSGLIFQPMVKYA